MAPIIYNIKNAIFREKMAAFDYDWTLVCPKDGKQFPKSIDDWQWLYPNIPNKIKQYYDDGFMIVIFTNQSKDWKCEQIKLVCNTLDIPIFVVIARDKSEYKPNIKLLNDFLDSNEFNKFNKELSFFIGDALGRKGDFSDSDKVFAENIGIKCFSPESQFQIIDEIKIAEIPLSSEIEIIIMVGYPGSGKSVIARNICKNENYIHIEGDIYKTSKKMIKNAPLDKSIVFDATNSSIKKRKEYIDFAKKFNYEIKCVHVKTSLDISYRRNKSRDEDKQVPKIAYSVYTKYYEEPKEDEGFTLYII